ncbi:MAG: hypothetical protein ABFC57_14010 [Veillonellales bacterium]
MPVNTPLQSPATKQSPNGGPRLRPLPAPLLDSSAPLYAAAETANSQPQITALHRQMALSYLHNPYCSDFRLLHSLRKQKYKITLEELRCFKQQYCLDNREVVCSMLMQLANQHGIKLNRYQCSFVEKVKPELRDLDLRQENPGDLVVYTCLFGRGVKGIGRVYLHLYADMYNGHIFGKPTHYRTLVEGLQVLKEEVLPLYLAGNLAIKTVLHSSSQPDEYAGLLSGDIFAGLKLRWGHTLRSLGTFEKIQRSLIQDDFFEKIDPQGTSLPDLQNSFTQWLKKYNFAAQVQLRYR